MSDEFVRKGEFELFQKHCTERHEEVDEVKEDIKDLRACMTKKFSGASKLLFLVLGGLVANLVLMYLSKGG